MTIHALWLGLAEEPQMKHEINKTCCDQTGSHWGPQAGSFQINSCQFLSKTITFHYFYYQTKRQRPVFGYKYVLCYDIDRIFLIIHACIYILEAELKVSALLVPVLRCT